MEETPGGALEELQAFCETLESRIDENSVAIGRKLSPGVIRDYLDEVERVKSAFAGESEAIRQGGERLAKTREMLTLAMRKHFGGRLRQLDDPEPRKGWIQKLIKLVSRDQGPLVRNQGSVNKYLIASMRSQLEWNRQTEHHLKTVVELNLKLCASLEEKLRAEMAAQEGGELSSSGRRIQNLLNPAHGGNGR